MTHRNDVIRYVAMSDDPWEECFIVRKVKIPKGYYFGITAATYVQAKPAPNTTALTFPGDEIVQHSALPYQAQDLWIFL